MQGSVFVEFADFKSVEAFLNADPKPAWDGKELLIMSKCVSTLSHLTLPPQFPLAHNLIPYIPNRTEKPTAR